MNLVYYTIGGDPKYIEMLRLSIESLRLNCDMTHTHVMVMCDEEYAKYVAETVNDVDIVIVSKSSNAMEISLKKIYIAEYEKLDMYDKVLFLDCDIIVKKDIIKDYVDKLDEIGRSHDGQGNDYKQKLHVCVEQKDVNWHNARMFGFGQYSRAQLVTFRRFQQFVFNCGQFAFLVCDEIRDHFKELVKMVDNHVGPYYYEQSFMNSYFNPRFLTIQSMTPFVQMPLLHTATTWTKDPYIVHYASGPDYTFEFKLKEMQQNVGT